MDTTNNDAAFWIAGYTDYLRDVVRRLIQRDLRYLPTVQHYIAVCSSSGDPDWSRFVRPAGNRVHPRGGRTQDGARPTQPCERHAFFLAVPSLARCCSERARPRHPEDPACTACQPADAPLLGATRTAVAASCQALSDGVS